MDNKAKLDNIFEPALIKEMFQFGEVRYFQEGAVIMDYGKYMRMMPIIIKGTVKVLRKDENGKEIRVFFLK